MLRWLVWKIDCCNWNNNFFLLESNMTSFVKKRNVDDDDDDDGVHANDDIRISQTKQKRRGRWFVDGKFFRLIFFYLSGTSFELK